MEFLLESAREIGMNALRVWGGGRFEAEEFYRMADRKGILLWHDLMFACALYPIDGPFLTNIKHEITTHITRIKNHPSILVWSGNNENELAIRQRWWVVGSYPMGQQIKDYITLYKDTIKPLVATLDESRPFLLSSPSNGVQTEAEGGVSINPGNPSYGDIHFYDDLSNLWTPKTFETPRCATEYVQSYPLKWTMTQYINESEWYYTSDDMLHRQHKPGGFITVIKQVFDHFQLPKGCNPSITNVSTCLTGNFMNQFAYLSQFHQAIAYQVELSIIVDGEDV
ncbi:hypothetical protein L596_025838 [Steinernema carpocapsae]|uniref:Glycoside hydrolase family 2 catalytic domain-containing protein n=1 Tax=Steinernema carpocapsae TaxID=34508 RepID=A0A4U5MA90_STECR|nr:hypothetical protein L596_025838 [Steinernema carpocapsae]